MVTNEQFLTAVFAEDAPYAHVTDFPDDPSNLPSDRQLAVWFGNYSHKYPMRKGTNQYFTISVFSPDEQGVARRRKALYLRTRTIVLDDVREKLSMEEVSKLPRPSWILETSQGSEQWGYILNEPCSDRGRVENLLDGLVANGLAPQGKDPGMKGVTRYVRLPEGYNTKASKTVEGLPFKCRMLLWEPFNTATLEQLAAPFLVDLDATRREARVDGAADVADHPLLSIPDIVQIKNARSDGRFEVTCPWMEDHTGAADDGAAIFTNSDGSMGFKCHHGACEGRTAGDLMRYIEGHRPGFRREYVKWKTVRAFSRVEAPVSFIEPVAPQAPAQPVTPTQGQAATPPLDADDVLNQAFDQLHRIRNDSAEARDLAQNILKAVDEFLEIDKKPWHDKLCDVMDWTKQDLKAIIRDFRREWYDSRPADDDFYDSLVYVKQQGQFYDFKTRDFYSVENFQNSYSHKDDQARNRALVEGAVKKVDRLDYAPKQPRFFEERGIEYANAWEETSMHQGSYGDATPWLNHFDALGWGEHREHMLQFMAYTLKHPEHKINHILLMGSGEGCGKDFLLYPLVKAMGENSETIDGNELLQDFNEYLKSTKHLHINETELGDHKQAMQISNKLKPLAAAPPDRLRMNPKGTKPVSIRNILNVTMTTNSQLPVKLNGPSRRFFAVWSDLQTRGEDDEMLPEWRDYWEKMWAWMKGGGYDQCIWYLMNQVDISSFKPYAAPPVTDFLRDIRAASISPMQATVEGFIWSATGPFECDLVSADEVATYLRAGDMVAPDLMQTQAKFFTSTKTAMILRDVSGCKRFNTYTPEGKQVKLWAVRNIQAYEGMTGRERWDHYQAAKLRRQGQPQMRVVDPNEKGHTG